MQEFDVYKDIAERTNGDIYVGVVGPVRVGKSTFITKFMENLVVPQISSKHNRERMRDELPQSADGKTIMTTQPKFVPNEAVNIRVGDNIDLNVRLVDCVGYLIDGAEGAVGEKQKPRMVKTPWADREMPFEEAAELGTKKVIVDHSTIGIVMTTDGSIGTDLPRNSYVPAEERVIKELQQLKKPFVIVLNSTVPQSNETKKLASSLSTKYNTPVIPIDCANLTKEDADSIFEKVLFEFPLVSIDVDVNKWLRALPVDNNIIASMIDNIQKLSVNMTKMSDHDKLVKAFEQNEYFSSCALNSVVLGSGKISYTLSARDDLFFKVLSQEGGVAINDEFDLMSNLKEMATAKKSYDKLRSALSEVGQNGYGVVTPSLDDMKLEEPQIFKQGSRFGVKLRASAPSLHIMQVDIQSEVSSMVGTEQQSEELVKYLLSEFESNPKGIWETNMFGKSLHSLVGEGLNNKLMSMPEDTQRKMRRSLSRIVNEGKGGVICILL